MRGSTWMGAALSFALVLLGCKERDRAADNAPPPPPPSQPATPAPDNSAPLSDQSDASNKLGDGEGYYGPTTRIDLGTLERDSIVAFSLDHPAAVVKADFTGQQRVNHCRERVATEDTLHVLCVDNVLGTTAIETVTIDGHFLVPRVADGVLPKNPEDDLVDALVTVTRKGKVLFAERRRFRWLSGE